MGIGPQAPTMIASIGVRGRAFFLELPSFVVVAVGSADLRLAIHLEGRRTAVSLQRLSGFVLSPDLPLQSLDFLSRWARADIFQLSFVVKPAGFEHVAVERFGFH
jgi:hypothetical protein